MNWQEDVAVAVGLGAGAFIVAQPSSFWIEFDQRVSKALLLLAWRYQKDAAGGGSYVSPGEEAGGAGG